MDSLGCKSVEELCLRLHIPDMRKMTVGQQKKALQYIKDFKAQIKSARDHNEIDEEVVE